MKNSASFERDVLLITFDDPRWVTIGDGIQEMLSRSGIDSIRCEYTHRLVPMPPAHKNAAKRISLIGSRGIDDASRLSREEYVGLCGDDIDFSAIDMFHVWRDGWPLDMEHLSPESVWTQRLRGCAWKFEGLLRSVNPSAVLVTHGEEVVSRLILAKGLKLGIPVIMLESGFVQGHVYMELHGQHFYRDLCRIDAIYRSGETAVDQKAAMALALARKERILANVSKYKQTTSAEEQRAFGTFCRKFEKIILLPEQIPSDANVFVNLSGRSSIHELYDAVIEALPRNAGLVLKRHPWARPEVPLYKGGGDNVLAVRDLSLAEIFGKKPAVATLSSNVGLEAALCGLPVLALGRPVYSGKGFTLDWDGAGGLAAALEDALRFVPDYGKTAAFYSILMRETLFDLATFSFSDFGKFTTPDEFTAKPDPKRPFWTPNASKSGEYAGFRGDFADLFYRNYSFPEILGAMGQEPGRHCSDRSRLDSGKRQTGKTCDAIRRNHRERYAFAAKLLPKSGRVLDAGCGVGYGSHFLAGLTGARIEGFDLSAESIAFAKQHYGGENIEFIESSAGSFLDGLSTDDGRMYDMIVAFEFLEHLPGCGDFVRGIKKRLRPDGVLICSVPNRHEYPIGDNQYHVRHYDTHSLLELMAVEPGEHCAVFGQSERGIEYTGAGNTFDAWRYLLLVLSRDREKIDKCAATAPFFCSSGTDGRWPGTDDMRGTDVHLFPFHRIPARSRVVIYGAGRFGYRYYRQATALRYCDILCVVDQKSGELKDAFDRCGVRIVSVDDIRDIEFDYVVPAAKSGRMRNEMTASLLGVGVPPVKIVDGAIVGY